MALPFYRTAHTKNELTQYYATVVNEDDIEIKVRAKRKPSVIGLALGDDWYHCYQRNWKKYRKTQWKN